LAWLPVLLFVFVKCQEFWTLLETWLLEVAFYHKLGCFCLMRFGAGKTTTQSPGRSKLLGLFSLRSKLLVCVLRFATWHWLLHGAHDAFQCGLSSRVCCCCTTYRQHSELDGDAASFGLNADLLLNAMQLSKRYLSDWVHRQRRCLLG
jgi:hypothetical protein